MLKIDEYNCPFCFSWVKVDKFKKHQESHEPYGQLTMEGAFSTFKTVETLDELKRRFEPLGMYLER